VGLSLARRPPNWKSEDQRQAMVLVKMGEADQFKRTHRQALAVYDRFKKEAQQSGEWIPGWAGKVGS
jgi:hypothetical protein